MAQSNEPDRRSDFNDMDERSAAEEGTASSSGVFEIEPEVTLSLVESSHTLMFGSDAIVLTPTQFAIVQYLAQRVGSWVTGTELLSEVLNGQTDRESSLVRVHLHKIRRKLGRHAARLQTERGLGTRLCRVVVNDPDRDSAVMPDIVPA